MTARLTTLGIPQELWDRVRTEEHLSDPPWKDAEHPDYTFRVTGVEFPTPDTPYVGAFRLGKVPQHPAQFTQLWPTGSADAGTTLLGGPFLMVWLTEVFPYDSAVSGEIRWQIGGKHRCHIIFDEGEYSEEAATRVVQGFRQWLEGLVPISRGGGPRAKDEREKGLNYERVESVTRRLFDAYRDRNENVKIGDVAYALNTTPRTVERWVKPKWKNWRELVSSLSESDLEQSL